MHYAYILMLYDVVSYIVLTYLIPCSKIILRYVKTYITVNNIMMLYANIYFISLAWHYYVITSSYYARNDNCYMMYLLVLYFPRS